MKTSGIGGQAVIEGIMMRNHDKYSIAVRKPDKQIEVVVKESKLMTEKYKWMNYPVIRGIFNFIDSLVVGISTISYSASFYDDPAEQKKTKADELGKAVFKDKHESVLMAVTIVFSIAFAVAVFMVLPYFISRIFAKYIGSQFLLNFLEGIVKVIIFILYILAISKMNDIKRTFMYHGAEHKCINCIENGARLTPENVKNSSRFHKRCGTSFLFFVIFLSIVFFIFIRVENTLLQVIIRLLLVPIIAGISYEIIKWAGKSNNKLEVIISKPGIWLQKLTTKEPDMDMIEVAIKAVNAVFDSEEFLKEYYKDYENPEAEIEAKSNELALSANLIMGTKKDTRTISVGDISDKNEEKHSKEEKYVDADSADDIVFEDSSYNELNSDVPDVSLYDEKDNIDKENTDKENIDNENIDKEGIDKESIDNETSIGSDIDDENGSKIQDSLEDDFEIEYEGLPQEEVTTADEVPEFKKKTRKGK